MCILCARALLSSELDERPWAGAQGCVAMATKPHATSNSWMQQHSLNFSGSCHVNKMTLHNSSSSVHSEPPTPPRSHTQRKDCVFDSNTLTCDSGRQGSWHQLIASSLTQRLLQRQRLTWVSPVDEGKKHRKSKVNCNQTKHRAERERTERWALDIPLTEEISLRKIKQQRTWARHLK